MVNLFHSAGKPILQHTFVLHIHTVYGSSLMTAFSQLDQQENYLSGFYAVMSYCHLFREKIKAGKIQSQCF